MGTTLDPSTGGWEVEKQFGVWVVSGCQSFSYPRAFSSPEFSFPTENKLCVCFFFFGSTVDQNLEPHVFWASGLLLSPITGTVTTFLNYFVI